MKKIGKITLLLFCLVLCVSASVTTLVLRKTRQTAPHTPIFSTVSRHIQAFQGANSQMAYLYCTAELQQKLSLGNFKQLTESRFPMITHAQRIEFGNLQFYHKEAVLHVYFITPDNIVTPCVYSLVKEKGEWKIQSVEPLPSWPSHYHLRGIQA